MERRRPSGEWQTALIFFFSFQSMLSKRRYRRNKRSGQDKALKEARVGGLTSW